MALSAEDNYDDFPDVQEQLNQSKNKLKVFHQTTSNRTSTVEATRDGTEDPGLKRTGDQKKRNPASKSSSASGEKGIDVKPRPKKRVLGRKPDNPLLRPISGIETARRSVSIDLTGETLRVKERAVREKKTMRGVKARDTDSSAVSPDSLEDSEGERSSNVERKVSSNQKSALTPGRRFRIPSLRIEPQEKTFKEDSDDLSDFIVNDSSIMEDSVVEISPPKSTRKLVRGRKPRLREELEDDDLGFHMEKLTVEDDIFATTRKITLPQPPFNWDCLDPPPRPSPTKKLLPKKNTNSSKPDKNHSPKKAFTSAENPDIEDPFTLSFSPSESKPTKIPKETKFATPPGSPKLKPKGLISPKKPPPIPPPPHRQSMDSFWQQDVINDWNDEYSPQKTPRPRPQPQLEDDNDLSEGALLFSPTKKSPIKADRAAKEAKKAFSHRKNELAESFLKELDQEITNGQIAKLSASTGGVKIIWSKKLNTTAGRANWKRETLKSKPSEDGKPQPVTHRHHAAIELAEKVIDDEDRLLNVIAHEFCHLANFMISNIKTNPHGKEFKVWAARCGKAFGDRGVEVTTKHSYSIDYKYVWECINCGLEFKRHSKSIDPSRHQCGSCKSRLVQTKPVPKNDGKGDGNGPKIGDYQLFVKENMKRIKEENPGSPQKEIMGLVGKRYQEEKAKKLREKGKGVESVRIREVGGSKEGTPEDDGIADVARKLVFLDLTSP